MSDVVQLTCSVPHGSVLGHLLFVLYTAELVDIAEDLGVSVHTCMYTDDTISCMYTAVREKRLQLSVDCSYVWRGSTGGWLPAGSN